MTDTQIKASLGTKSSAQQAYTSRPIKTQKLCVTGTSIKAMKGLTEFEAEAKLIEYAVTEYTQ